MVITDMKGAIIDFRADGAIVNNLERLGVKVIPSMENTEDAAALSGHPDMQICKCADDVYVCCPSCYEYYKNALSEFNVKIFKGDTSLDSNYPRDIAYNVAWIGKTAVHNFRYTDPVISAFFENAHVKMIDVSQGYSKCNICIVSEDAVITSDRGIYKSLTGAGLDTLLICEGYIDIHGWDCGFIGGACGMLGGDILAFCGDVSTHPDYEKIQEFCAKYNVKCLSLSNKRLMDMGSVITV